MNPRWGSCIYIYIEREREILPAAAHARPCARGPSAETLPTSFVGPADCHLEGTQGVPTNGGRT